MSERIAFVQACLDRSEAIVDICARFGISEKTGHKLLRRFREDGFDGLVDRSRARLTHPHRITPEVAGRIIAIRRKYPLYGPQTIRDILLQQEPQVHWPAASSIGELLKKANLVCKKRRRSPSAEHAALETGRARALAPNSVWTADFKGQFRLKGGGSYCYPLTIMDLHSRYLLSCAALESVGVATAQKVFMRLFQEHGLPSVLRTDNGVPFCQPNALGRLGKLGFWWVRLGIRPEHTKPATPSDNGAHERFHRTLKAATASPSAQSLQSQQRRFDNFKREYNEHRPHRSLPSHLPPAQFYSSSPRPYPKKLPVMTYAADSDVRLVTNGYIKWRKRDFFISSNLAGEYVGLSETAGDLFLVSYGPLELGHLDPNTYRFTPNLKWSGQP